MNTVQYYNPIEREETGEIHIKDDSLRPSRPNMVRTVCGKEWYRLNTTLSLITKPTCQKCKDKS